MRFPSFLDLSIRLEMGKLVTKTYRKKTAANTLLFAESYHPKPLIHGIPEGQFLRTVPLRMTTDVRQRNSYRCFGERGYSHLTLRRAKKIAMQSTKADLRTQGTSVDVLESPVRLIT